MGRNTMIFVLAAAILIAACKPVQVVVVTATPTMSEVGNQSPTFVSNPHTQCLETSPFCSVSVNPEMAGPMRIEYKPTSGGVTRTWQIPKGWQVFYRHGSQCTNNAGSELQTPDIWATPYNFVISTAWIAGCIDLETTYDTYKDVRYLVQMKYQWRCNSPQATSSQVAVGATVYRADGSKIDLEYQFLDHGSSDLRTVNGEAMWLVSPGERRESTVTFRIFIPAGVCGGDSTMTVTKAGIIAVRNTYGSESEVYR